MNTQRLISTIYDWTHGWHGFWMFYAIVAAFSRAILLIIEFEQLTAHARGISTPQRIVGATWPSDSAWNAGT